MSLAQPSLTVRNLRTTLSFTGDANEAYFHLNTLQIEATGGPAIASLDKVLADQPLPSHRPA